MPENLKTVATYSTPIEAEMARNRLEASGIQAFLAGDQTVGWLWHLGTAMPGVKVLVAGSDLQRAREVLESVREPPDEDRPSQAWTCPKCGAEVDGELETCWACGTTADGLEDADFQHADAPPSRAPEEKVGPKGPPSAVLALLIAFCVPMYVFNTMVGFDILVREAASPISGGSLLLVLACDLLLVVGLFHWFYYRPPAPPEAEMAAEDRRAAAGATLAEEEGWEPAAVEVDALARRACLAALLGLVFCPMVLNLYSIWLILRYELYRPEVRRRSAFFVYTAIVINAAACLVPLMLFLAAGGLARR